MTTTPRPPAGESKKTPTEPVDRGETRSTHDQSLTTEAVPTTEGGARPRVEPQLPHEIDESAHSQACGSARQVDVGEQAFADTVGPSQDTDRGPVLDTVYNATLAPDRGAAKPRE
jgi:hypothetical protein